MGEIPIDYQVIMFTGKFLYSVDSKKRLSLPAELRKQLKPEANETFVLLPGVESYINIYPLDEWLKFSKVFEKLSEFDPRQSYFKRKMLEYVSEKKLDGQSRLIIPQILIDNAKIESEVMIVGQWERIELWNPKLYEELDSRYPESFAEIAKSVMHGN
ncbi:MAG: division/cell wall cluster transcriptional repressor MraZ [Bacteroidetes bacterium]|nr:division/cell wall cluster transcriptional repressor MraZ [Bacteroidota bacterium]MBU2585076.1 division/cell wall cluster transcriptional repressor MraZ [Bacteroidota bacterium]